MLSRIKFRLLRWLMDDICVRSGGCEHCGMLDLENSNRYFVPRCAEGIVYKQAMKAWGFVRDEKNGCY